MICFYGDRVTFATSNTGEMDNNYNVGAFVSRNVWMRRWIHSSQTNLISPMRRLLIGSTRVVLCTKPIHDSWITLSILTVIPTQGNLTSTKPVKSRTRTDQAILRSTCFIIHQISDITRFSPPNSLPSNSSTKESEFWRKPVVCRNSMLLQPDKHYHFDYAFKWVAQQTIPTMWSTGRAIFGPMELGREHNNGTERTPCVIPFWSASGCRFR